MAEFEAKQRLAKVVPTVLKVHTQKVSSSLHNLIPLKEIKYNNPSITCLQSNINLKADTGAKDALAILKSHIQNRRYK